MGIFGKKKKEDLAPGLAAATDLDSAAATEAAAGAGEASAHGAAEDSELIAVIAAAVAAYEAEQFRQTLYIKKLNRTAGIRPAWGVIGTQEAIDVRRI